VVRHRVFSRNSQSIPQGAEAVPPNTSSNIAYPGHLTLVGTSLSYGFAVFPASGQGWPMTATINGPAPVGAVGPAIFDLGLGSPGHNPPGWSGWSGTIDNLTSKQIDDLFAGLWYVNVFGNPSFPGGEFRGPITLVPALAESWTQTSAPTTNWSCVASSADGSRLVATVRGGLIYSSADSGKTWTPTSAPATNWLCVASSADGSKLAAGGDRTFIYCSTNYGADWTAISPPGTTAQQSRWGCLVSCGDGSTLVALPINGDYGLYGSTNSGADWVVRTTRYIIPEVWIAKWRALSADGARLALVYGADVEVWTRT